MLMFASNLKPITRKNGHFTCLPLGNKVFLFFIFYFYVDDYDLLVGIIICIIQALSLSVKHYVSHFVMLQWEFIASSLLKISLTLSKSCCWLERREVTLFSSWSTCCSIPKLWYQHGTYASVPFPMVAENNNKAIDKGFLRNPNLPRTLCLE